MRAMLTALAMLASIPSAQAAVIGLTGNDTSGIIPWSPEAEWTAREDAAAHCARWGKYPRITGVVRQYGNYISFNCLWNPRVSPYAPAPVALRRHPYWRHSEVEPTGVVLRSRD